MYEGVIQEVPAYKTFYTVDELNESSARLAGKHPDRVKLFGIGKSRNGEPIKALKIGDGENASLLFGFPHPNEPIGSMMLEYLSWKLVEDEKLLERLGFTWYIVKCIDPDGARLNEGWFKGPFKPLNFALNYYRPPGYQQIEWTFPIRYKTLVWDRPIPETKALMALIDRVKPDFLYSLHNSGFGGVYFYVSDPCPPLYPTFQNLAKEEELPLHLGEPEAPYMEKLADAIFRMPTSKERYDFLNKHTDKDPAEIINCGTSSDDYAKRAAGSFTLVCEMPYYYDPRIGNTSESEELRKDAVLKSIKLREHVYRYVKEKYGMVKDLLKEKSPFAETIKNYLNLFPDNIAAEKHWAETAQELERKATVAEKFDSQVITRFHGLLALGLLHRCVEEAEQKKISTEIRRDLERWNQELEENLNYRVIPIRRLVRVQLGSALYAAEYVRENY